MTKEDIIEVILASAEDMKINLTRKEAYTLGLGIFQAVRNELVNVKVSQLPLIGTLRVIERQEKTARNPRTGEPVTVPAQNGVKFKPIRALKDAVN